MTESVIEAEGLSKRYGEVTALDSLDLSVPPGELYGFLGREPVPLRGRRRRRVRSRNPAPVAR